jgi:Ca2+-binding RTX toxin-like protein
MSTPNSKLYLTSLTASVTGGYSFFANTLGDFSQTITSISAAPWIAGITDINGDLIPDTIIGAPGDDDKLNNAGRVFVNFGQSAGGTSAVAASSTAGLIIDGVNAGDMAGSSVGSVTDLNKDGKAEILVGASGMDNGALVDAGVAFVVWGRGAGGFDLKDAYTGGGGGYAIKGEAAYDAAGTTMASIADLNGDGKAEILVGAVGSDTNGADAGAAYVVWGKSSASAVNLSNVALGTGGFKIIGQSAGDAAGQGLGRISDLNGDGKSEILIGATGNDGGGVNSGAAYVVFGKSTGVSVNLNDVAAGIGGYRITGQAGDAIGASLTDIGDVNGDGLADILVGSSASNRAYVVFGKSTTGEVLLSDVANGIGGFAIKAEASGDLANMSVAYGEDFNHDGYKDFLIGAPHNGEGGSNAGALYIVWGGGASFVDLSVIAAGMGGVKIIGSAGSLTGSAVATLGDLNGDGTKDIMIASPGGSETVSIVYASATWQPDINVYGSNLADVMGNGFGGLNKIGSGNDYIMALGGNDTVSSGDGNDTIDGGAGADSLSGGLGDDTYLVDNALDTVVEAAGEGIDTVIASASVTLAANVEILKLGVSSLTGTGNAQDNTIIGTAGSDTLNGGAGNDTLTGGAGNDTYAIDSLADVIEELAAGGTDSVISSVDYTLGANLENLTLSNPAHVATGNALNNRITGTVGDDTLDGAAGADTLTGGAGNDVYNVDNALDSVVELAGGGVDTVVASINYTLGANVENLQLQGLAHVATGNALANSLTGTGGDDSLDGAAGADTMAGGLGNDTYSVETAGDIIIEAADGGIDTLNVSIDGYILADNIENLNLTGLAHSATGNAAINSLTGSAGADTLDGGAGADILAGAAGNDVYLADDLGDHVTETVGAGTDLVIASVSGFVLADNVENLTLAGLATSGSGNALDNVLTGNALDNVLSGDAGNDSIDGGAGADTMTGGDGDDTYYIDNSGDVVVELAGGGIDTVVINADWTLSADSNIENVRVTGTGHTVTGNAGNNALSGSSGADTLDGGEGDDIELGGDGDDTLVSRNGIDSLSGGTGDDTYVVSGGRVEIEDFLGHDTLDAHEATGNSIIDLSGQTACEIEGQTCHIGQGGTTLAPLDVQFLQDLTGSFGNDIASVRTLVPQIVTAIQGVQSNSRFGVSSFVDKAVSPFGATGEWVYKLQLGMTNDAAALASTYNSMNIMNGVDAPEAQIESLMHLALTTAEVGFRPDAARFVILFTDAPFHVAGDGASAGILTPNNGDAVLDGVIPGTGEDYPAIVQLKAALEAANIIPIFAVTADVTSYYTSLIASLGRGTAVTLSADSANIVSAITNGLSQATVTVIEDAVGGGGDDRLSGNLADNALSGGAGNDTIDGGDGDDHIDGGTGNDVFMGGTGADQFVGGTGADTVSYESAAAGVTAMLGNAAANTGDAAGDTYSSIERLTGSAFDDILSGDLANNTMIGGAGNDTLDGGLGNDNLQGGDGNDIFMGGAGADRLYGGAGTDTVTYENAVSGVTAMLGNAVANTGDAAGDTYSSIERLTGSAFDDILSGNTASNTIAGGAGNDTLDGGLGSDNLQGGDGNDVLTGGAGADRLYGSAGLDTVSYENAATGVTAMLGNAAANTGDAAGDTYSSIERLTGSAFDDILSGNTASNTIAGGAGSDILSGGLGKDVLSGGAGQDSFVFALNNGTDTVLDFTAAEDTFLLDAATFGIASGANILDYMVISDSAVGVPSAPTADHGYFLVNQTGMYWDDDGAGVNAAVELAGFAAVPGLTVDDFAFL